MRCQRRIPDKTSDAHLQSNILVMVCPNMSTIPNYNVYHATCWSGGPWCVFTSRSRCPPHQTGRSGKPSQVLLILLFRNLQVPSGPSDLCECNPLEWKKKKKNPLTGLLESRRIDTGAVSESWFLQKTSSSDRAAIKAPKPGEEVPLPVWLVSPQGPSAASFLSTKAQAGSESKALRCHCCCWRSAHWWRLLWIRPVAMYRFNRWLQMPTPAPILYLYGENIFIYIIFFPICVCCVFLIISYYLFIIINSVMINFWKTVYWWN